jgi:hypothetical protein
MLLVLANTRLNHGVDVEVADNKEAYLGRHAKLRDIDVRPITETGGDVVGYARAGGAQPGIGRRRRGPAEGGV